MEIAPSVESANQTSTGNADSGVADERPLVVHARVVTSTGGGPDKTIINSPRFLKEFGYRSICAFFRPPGDEGFEILRDRAATANAEIIEIDDRGKLDPSAIRQAIRLCRERNVSIWHAHDYKTNLIGLIAKRFHPMKLITTAHGWVNFAGQTPRYYRWDKRWFLPRYEKVICVSPTVLQQCVEGGVPESRCIMIDNAIDHAQFSRQRSTEEAKRQDHQLEASEILIGSIGRLSEEKGYDLLIESVATLLQRGLKVRLMIAGEGPAEKMLQRKIVDCDVSDHVRLIGFCGDTRAFLESMDIFVLSSLREGLPNSLLEAMAVGVPVVATRVGGVPRLVKDDSNGLLIDPGQVDQITDALDRLLEDPNLGLRLGRSASSSIAQDWSFRRRIERISGIYGELK